MLSQKDFEEAYHRLVESGVYGISKSSKDLEGRIIFSLSIVMITLPLIISSLNITGFSVFNLSTRINNTLGILSFIMGFVLVYFYSKFKTLKII